jgi:hypothetical protein
MARARLTLGGGLFADVDRSGAPSVALSGSVTEAADLKPLTQLGNQVRFDLSGVKHVNSLGVRGWVVFIRACEQAGVTLIIDRVSPVMVSQMSMITHFMGKNTVTSLFAPYLCESCGSEHNELIIVTPGIPPTVAPSVQCPKCKATMVLDNPLDLYTSLFKS